MAARNTASMAPGGAASSRVCGIGGSPRNKPHPAPAPIFVAEKLFDEFSLGRINALSSSSSSSSSSADTSITVASGASEKASIGSDPAAGKIGRSDTGFQPSAPPFECIGRSNAELYGFNDIFGGLPGIKPSSRADDVFSMGGAGSKNPAQNTPVSRTDSPRGSSPRMQGTSAGSPRVPKEGDRLDTNGSQSQQRFPTTGQSLNTSGSYSNGPLFGDTVSSAAPSSSSLPTSYSTRSGRGGFAGGAIGSSRFRNASAEARDGQSQNLENHQQQQNSVPPYTVKTSPHQKSSDASTSASTPNTALLTDLRDPVTSSGKVATPPASNMPSWFPGVTKVGSVQKLPTENKEAGPTMNAKVPLQSKSSDRHSSKSSEKPLQDDHKVDPHAAQEKSLAADEVLLSKENVTWESKTQSDTATVDSPPRKTKRPSATERLKAVLFPDFGKKEDKSKAKSWFTVGDLKLVTQPTDVPPPNRAPPEMEHSQKSTGSRSVYKRDERWRRNSCEFPSSKDVSFMKEAHLQGKSQPLPRANGEDFVGLSSSATAMKEAVERAEAKIKQKQRTGEPLPNTAEANTRKPDEMKEALNSHHIEKEGDMDRKAVERAAHELREKALRKAAERAAADPQKKFTARAENVENTRSTSAPKQRISDEAERNAKKVFFSGEQCRPMSNLSRQPEPARNLKAEEDEKKQRNDKILEERAAKVLAEKNQRDLTLQQEQAERQRVSATVDAQIKAWVAGKEGNLRALLLSLQDVLWLGSGWQAVSSSELNNEASIKKAYRRATLCVHPDKIQQRGATIQEKLIAEKVFDVLKGAWTKFNSQEAFFWQASV